MSIDFTTFREPQVGIKLLLKKQQMLVWRLVPIKMIGYCENDITCLRIKTDEVNFFSFADAHCDSNILE